MVVSFGLIKRVSNITLNNGNVHGVFLKKIREISRLQNKVYPTQNFYITRYKILAQIS